MTKVRAPLSIDLALARIAGLLPGGWAQMAVIVGRAETTIRKWGDDAQPEQLPMAAAIVLDIAYQRAGGIDRPIFDTYALQLKLAREHAFSCEVAIARQHGVVLRESGQAHEALILATLPSATEADRINAIREGEDVVREMTGLISLLNQPRPPPDTS